jgi:hypothetical protein
MGRPLLTLALGLALLSPLAAQTSVSELASQVIANEIRLDQRIESYTFEFESRVRAYAPSGKVRSEMITSGETYMSPVTNIDVVLKRAGKAMKPGDVEKERSAAVARLTADATRPPYDYDKEIGPAGWSNGKVHMSVVDVLRYCSLSERRPEGGFFDNCKSPFPVHAHFPRIKGTILIDAQTHTMNSWKALIRDGPAQGAVLYEQTTQADPGGMRVPASFHINLAAAPYLFPDSNYEVTYRWTHPQRFGVESQQTIQSPDLPVKPPHSVQ